MPARPSLPFSNRRRLLGAGLLAVALSLGACATVSGPSSGSQADAAATLYRQGDLDGAARAYLELAARSGPDAASEYRLRAGDALRDNGDLTGAERALDGIKRRRLAGDGPVRLDLLDAEIALSRGDAGQALSLLVMRDDVLPGPLRARALELRARAQAASGDGFAAARTRAELDTRLHGADREQNRQQLLDTLRTLPPDALKGRAISLRPEDPLRPWIEQALHGSGFAIASEPPRAERPAGTLIGGDDGATRREGFHALRRIALLLPLDGPLASLAQSVRDGFLTAYFGDDTGTRPQVFVYDSGRTPQDALAAYQRAVADGADQIVGPLQREAVGEIFRNHPRVPVLALNQPDSGDPAPAGSAAWGLLPDTEGAQAATHLLERGLGSAVVFAADSEWAERAALAFRAQFEAGGGRVTGEARLREGEINFKPAIQSALAGADADATQSAVFMTMRPQQARLLVPQLKLAGVTAPMFATSHVYAIDAGPGLDRDLDGVEFCDAPWLFGDVAGQPSQASLARELGSAAGAGARLFALGIDAYRLAPFLGWALAHPDTYVDGTTGQLSADRLGRIQRVLAWGRFDGGSVRPAQGMLVPHFEQ